MAQFHPGTTTDPTQSAMAKTSPATVVTPRARVIQRLLWTSLALTIMTFAVSMVFFGFMSMFISLAGVGCCLILDITLLALSAKERRLAAQTSAATIPGVRPNSYPPSNIPSAKGPLPCTLRKPSIIFALFFVVVWGGALVMVIYFLVYFDALEQPNHALIAAPILEAIFIGTHIAVLLTFAILAWKERVKRVAGGDELKWWQLGDYKDRATRMSRLSMPIVIAAQPEDEPRYLGSTAVFGKAFIKGSSVRRISLRHIMSPPHDPRHAIMTPINRPHIRRIQRILITSAVLSIVSFGFSMVLFAGFLSFYITPSAAAASIIFDATLLALTVKEERADSQAAAGRHEPEAGLGSSNEATGANHSTRPRSRQISATLRKASIFVAIGLVVAWLGASGCLLYFLGSFSSLELGNENYKVFAPILELIFNISHAAVLGSYAVKSWFERERLLDPIVIPSSTTFELSQLREVKVQVELGSPTKDSG